jgi:hypothetical protein
MKLIGLALSVISLGVVMTNLGQLIFLILFFFSNFLLAAEGTSPYCDGLKYPNEIAENQDECEYLKPDKDANFTQADRLNYTPDIGGPLTLAEKVAIADYTISYARVENIIVAGAQKLELSAGTFYRGEKGKYTEKDIGSEIVISNRFKSVSKSQYIAEGFLDVEKDSRLLIITAKSARDISTYSQGHSDGALDEQELLLMPGTRLKINKIFTKEIEFDDADPNVEKKIVVPVQVVELSEV